MATRRSRSRRRGQGSSAGPGRQMIETAQRITRTIPDFAVLDDEAIEMIEHHADTVLEEIGVEFPDNPTALALWREAGADVKGTRIHIPRGLARQLCATAPASFIQQARNPANNVMIGGRDLVLSPVYGPPFVRDLEAGRRYATIEDFRNFVKLGYLSKWLHHSGGTLCEPTDLPVTTRHLDMLHAHITYSDKPFMGSVTEPSRAEDSIAMARLVFGDDALPDKTVLTSLININSPLVFDAVMMGALEVYARAGQATVISPFIVGGAMSPVSVAGTLTQVLAEVLAGIAYAQMIRPGVPVILGAFVATIDMKSGAPTFGTPEASLTLYGAGQLARRMNLPFRSGGSLCTSKLPDAQAAYETANTLNAGLLGGVNFMVHAAGWLEGGLVASFEKFIMDDDQLGVLHTLAAGSPVTTETLALDAIHEVQPGGHYLGCAHTLRHFETAFWRSEILDHKPFETWEEAGSPETVTLANQRLRKRLAAYAPPALDPAISEAIGDFIARRKAELPASAT